MRKREIERVMPALKFIKTFQPFPYLNFFVTVTLSELNQEQTLNIKIINYRITALGCLKSLSDSNL